MGRSPWPRAVQLCRRGLTDPSPSAVNRFRHEALFYSGSAEFVNGTVPFVREGVASGEPVLVVESPEKIKTLRAALERDADQVFFADMSEVGANPARIIPAWCDFVNRHWVPGKSLRGIGEPIWSSRGADELVECQRHESLLNVAFGRGRPWSLLCPYDTATLRPEVIDEARRSHEFIVEGGSARRSENFRGIDASAAAFSAPLASAPPPLDEVTFEKGDLRRVRELVRKRAVAAGLDESRAYTLAVATNEVATNSILHGGGSGTLRIWQDVDRVICEVRDRGVFDLPLVDREAPGPDPSSPRGLWLANQLCDLVQIRTFHEATVVRLHMRLDPRANLSLVTDVESTEATMILPP
ncbi:MAG: sensor histidine kinase [Chloroflexi bacterium]|nr:MAG: sensor histidine kinase [Chloroflexota bacterium]TMD73413.1 MAG: sensor histidine kinase [Chloroflexota bacterium]